MNIPKLSAAEIVRVTELITDILIVGIGKAGVPSGELYAMVMNSMPLDIYESVLNLLIHSGMATQGKHYITLTAEGEAKRREIEQREMGTKNVTP